MCVMAVVMAVRMGVARGDMRMGVAVLDRPTSAASLTIIAHPGLARAKWERGV
jgi:hypothetical protein